MRDDVMPAARSSLADSDLEDASSSSYASGTGLLFVAVIIALSATALCLLSLARG
jgi:hypothetical protein